MGVDSTLARFQQLSPTMLLLGEDGAPAEARPEQLVRSLPSLTSVVMLDDMSATPALSIPVLRLADLAAAGTPQRALTAREQERCRLRTLSTNVTFVRPDERDALQCDPVAVWQRATHSEPLAVRTPGGHNDSLTLPHVSQLGKRLSALLDEA